MKKGKFIVLEGLDGSGQTTQTNLLKEYLEGKEVEVVVTKEPTKDSEAGREIRVVLQHGKTTSPADLQKMFAQDRREHLQNKIIPALESGKWVISDRYYFSSFAFGSSDGLDLDWLIDLNKDFLTPDQIFILKVSPQICIQRIIKRGIKKELFEDEEKLARVWKTYEILPKRFSNSIIVDGEKSPEEVFFDIKKIIEKNI